MEQNQHQKELHDVIVRARQVFPDENIFYDIGGKQAIPDFIAQLKKRIAVADQKYTPHRRLVDNVQKECYTFDIQ